MNNFRRRGEEWRGGTGACVQGNGEWERVPSGGKVVVSSVYRTATPISSRPDLRQVRTASVSLKLLSQRCQSLRLGNVSCVLS